MDYINQLNNADYNKFYEQSIVFNAKLLKASLLKTALPCTNEDSHRCQLDGLVRLCHHPRLSKIRDGARQCS